MVVIKAMVLLAVVGVIGGIVAMGAMVSIEIIDTMGFVASIIAMGVWLGCAQDTKKKRLFL